MFVGVGRFELRLPECSSLKDKRSVMRSVTTLLRNRFNAAVAEVAHQDLRQRATLAVAVVSGTTFHTRRMLREIERHIATAPGVEMLSHGIDLFSPEE